MLWLFAHIKVEVGFFLIAPCQSFPLWVTNFNCTSLIVSNQEKLFILDCKINSKIDLAENLNLDC